MNKSSNNLGNLLPRAKTLLAINDSLASWSEFCGFKPAAHHRLLIDVLEKAAKGIKKKVILVLPTGSAKALALETPILTNSGWSTMEDLKVGDQVFDETGFPCNVIRKSEVFKNRPVYAVKTDCGDEIIADEDHEWVVTLPHDDKACRQRGIKKLLTTKSLLDITSRKHGRKPLVDKNKFLKFKTKELPIHPYVLGLWLGDGTSLVPQMTIGPEDQEFICGEIARLGIVLTKNKATCRFEMIGIRHLFTGLNLLGNKHIPERYLFADADQRLELLQGLIDTDGSVSPKGAICFTNTNENIARGVQFLVRSLGCKAGFNESRAALYGKDCGPVYRVNFFMEKAAKMPRKAVRCKNGTRTPNTYISFEKRENQDTICIEVDSPSHLFLAGHSLTPTHNSTYSSVLFPPWYLMKYPRNGILACSHGAVLAKHFGRKCRDLIDKYPEELGYKLSSSSQAADEWEIQEGGYFFSAGVTGSIAGRRAHLGLIDDPVGSREQADSQGYRDKVWEWYRWDFTRRLQPNASVVIISTRWHEDDLVGRLLAAEPGEWELIHVPFTVETAEQEAIDPLGRKIGQRIWPEYFTAEMERELRKDPRAWQALQQGSPSPDEGAHFTKEMLVGYNSYNDIPKEIRVYSVSDHAVRTKQANDRTCIINFGVDSRNHIWILPDVWWKRGDTLEATEQMLAVAKRHKPLTWWSGRDNIRGSIGPFLRQRMMEEQIYINMVEVVEGKDLMKRSQSIHGRASMGMVHFPVFASWWPLAMDEILKFPRASHDDFLAALALIGMGLDQLVAAPMAEIENEPEPFCLKDVTAKWLRNQRDKQARKESEYAHGL